MRVLPFFVEVTTVSQLAGVSEQVTDGAKIAEYLTPSLFTSRGLAGKRPSLAVTTSMAASAVTMVIRPATVMVRTGQGPRPHS